MQESRNLFSRNAYAKTATLQFTYHHQVSVDIIAALKTGFSNCQKSITLVEAYCAGILIIHREPDTI